MGKSAGKVMPRPRGAYNESETYKILDMVTLDNKLWIAKQSDITGITPSKTTPEWMMAVDGTTDVKALETEVEAKFASIDEQFLAKDTQISGLDERVTAAEGSIAELDGKFVFDDAPTQDSTNLITSGAAYNMLNGSYNNDVDDSTYVHYKNKLSIGSQSSVIYSSVEQYSQYTDGTIMHRKMTGGVECNDMGGLRLSSVYSTQSDNTHTSYIPESSEINLNGNNIELSLRNGDFSTGKRSVLFFNVSAFESNTDSSYDIGSSSRKFKDIYASNGTIQTSDSTEKKDIYDLDSGLVNSIVMGLRPVSFKFINGTSDRTHYGLVAQEVEETVNGLGISNQDFAPLIKSAKVDDDGNIIDGEYVYGLRYAEFIGILIKMCQNLQNEVDELKTRLGGA